MDSSERHIEVLYTRPQDRWNITASAERIAALLGPFDGRRRAFLAKLLNGYSKKQAAGAVGVSPRATQLWAAKDPSFASAVQECDDIGFGTVYEAELYERALNRADPGSIRALELILRSRREEYRS